MRANLALLNLKRCVYALNTPTVSTLGREQLICLFDLSVVWILLIDWGFRPSFKYFSWTHLTSETPNYEQATLHYL